MHSSIDPPNPQGKGITPVLESLLSTRSASLPAAKDIHQISHELFTSLFVLHSRILFKPVVGHTYWLYRKDESYRLSLIAPAQWSPTRYGRCIGACELQSDLTWTLQLSTQCRNDRALMTEIAERRAHFERKLKRAECIDDLLPVYLENLPFYGRVLASALAHSLGQSMKKSGISGLSFQQAQKRALLAKDRME